MPGYRTGSFDVPKDLDKTTTPDNTAVFIPMTGTIDYQFPATLQGLIGWWPVDKLVGFNDGDSVSPFPDQSGKGNDFSRVTQSAKPIYKVNILNGKPVLRCTGSSQQGLFANTPIGFTLAPTQAFTAFCVVRKNAPDNNNETAAVFSNNDATQTAFIWAMLVGRNVESNQQPTLIADVTQLSAGARVDVITPTVLTNFNVYGMSYDGSAGLAKFAQVSTLVTGITNASTRSLGIFNGVAWVTAVPQAIGRLVFGTAGGGQGVYDIAEALLYNVCMSEHQMQAVGQYLREKYKL